MQPDRAAAYNGHRLPRSKSSSSAEDEKFMSMAPATAPADMSVWCSLIGLQATVALRSVSLSFIGKRLRK